MSNTVQVRCLGCNADSKVGASLLEFKCPVCYGAWPRAAAQQHWNDAHPRPAGGLKFDGGKPQPTLLMRGCAKAIAGVIAVLGFGAKKYAADSWKQVEDGETRYRDALYRHLSAIEQGETHDPESGLPHIDHIACNALFLSQKFHDAEK